MLLNKSTKLSNEMGVEKVIFSYFAQHVISGYPTPSGSDEHFLVQFSAMITPLALFSASYALFLLLTVHRYTQYVAWSAAISRVIVLLGTSTKLTPFCIRDMGSKMSRME